LDACPFLNTAAKSRHGALRRSRNQIVLVPLLVLLLDFPISDDDEDEDEKFARPTMDWTDTASEQLSGGKFCLY
jgi:hypothetical protein